MIVLFSLVNRQLTRLLKLDASNQGYRNINIRQSNVRLPENSNLSIVVGKSELMSAGRLIVVRWSLALRSAK